MLSGEQWAWVAGILEGEGTFLFHHNGKGQYYPQVEINMTDGDIIERLQGLVGGRLYSREPTRDERAVKIIYRITVSRRDEVEPLLKGILSWMGHRRTARIHELLALYS